MLELWKQFKFLLEDNDLVAVALYSILTLVGAMTFATIVTHMVRP